MASPSSHFGHTPIELLLTLDSSAPLQSDDNFRMSTTGRAIGHLLLSPLSSSTKVSLGADRVVVSVRLASSSSVYFVALLQRMGSSTMQSTEEGPSWRLSHSYTFQESRRGGIQKEKWECVWQKCKIALDVAD